MDMKLYGRFLLAGFLSIAVVVWGYFTIPMILYSDAVSGDDRFGGPDWLYLSVGSLGIVFLWALAFIWIVQPVRDLVRAFRMGGNREVYAQLGNRNDEIGEIARAMRCLEAERKTLHDERVLRESAEKRAEDAAAATERANQGKGQFLSFISHEIRTPLNSIIGFGELFDQSSEMGEREREYLLHIRKSGKSLLCIIDDILDYSRLGSGMLQLESKAFSLKNVIEAVFHLESDQAQNSGIELEFNIDPNVPQTIYSDPDRLKRVLRNLVNNAIKFTHEGRVRISTWAEVVSTQPSGKEYGYVHVAVDDTGIGLDGDDIAGIFEPFSKTHKNALNRGGMGMGLAISQLMVQAMGGKIVAIPKEGEGARFEFSIYCQFNPSIDSLLVQSEKETGLNDVKFSVMVAEDDKGNRRLMEVILKQLGYDPVLVENGRFAESILREKTFDLLLLDIQMPDVGGLELVKRIRSGELGEDCQKMKIIAVTAYALDAERDAFIANGFDACLAKPVSNQAIIELLSESRS